MRLSTRPDEAGLDLDACVARRNLWAPKRRPATGRETLDDIITGFEVWGVAEEWMPYDRNLWIYLVSNQHQFSPFKYIWHRAGHIEFHLGIIGCDWPREPYILHMVG